jgi:cell wall assembly regulator SMI1
MQLVYMKDVIRSLVTELDKEVTLLAERHGKQDVRPKPHPPATVESIQRYEGHLQLTIPASFRDFLELHDGYDWLAFPGHMLAIASVMPGGDMYDEILEWKRTTAEYGSAEVLDGVVIASLGGPNNWVYFDPNKPLPDNEFTVVRWLNGDFDEYPNLAEFFRARIRFCKGY